MKPAKPPNYALELSLLAALATLWGASYTFIKLGIETIPPVTLIAARTVIAGAVLLVILRLRGIVLPRDAATWRKFAVQACLNSVVPFTLIAWAEKSVDAGLAVILNAMTPVFTFLITVLWTRHEPTTFRKMAGVAVGLAGTCVIVGMQAFQHVGQELLGQLAVVLATVCYAGAAIFGRNFKGLDPMAPAAGSLVCGAAILIPVSLVVDRPWTLSPSGTSVGALVGLAVFSTALAFVLYFRLIHTLGSVGTTAQGYLRAPIGVAIGAYFLGERLDSSAWIGLVCILAGVALMTLPRRIFRPALGTT
ncbi:DMT family transporter [Microvirga sp. 17 mud 1-3]|uniref:DMT family transporter n=1 Tax=Microvirga sp. 17 mud 1-3 TaxID=2082949 RepID=UPI000D6AA811|nr:EamA family transporter [Microvirga sp. 17 mud 1-3]AWM86825.1 EamA family transporter [Microvirga sp. 17 mud 1-3]